VVPIERSVGLSDGGRKRFKSVSFATLCLKITITSLHSFYSLLRQVHRLFQSEFSAECDPVFSVSVCCILFSSSHPSCHPLAAYVLFLSRLPSLCLSSYKVFSKAFPSQFVISPGNLPSFFFCLVHSFPARL
jgi:hypothetical protein